MSLCGSFCLFACKQKDRQLLYNNCQNVKTGNRSLLQAKRRLVVQQSVCLFACKQKDRQLLYNNCPNVKTRSFRQLLYNNCRKDRPEKSQGRTVTLPVFSLAKRPERNLEPENSGLCASAKTQKRLP